MNKKCIIIATSPYGNSVTDFWKNIVEELILRGYFLVVVFDQKHDNSVENSHIVHYYHWSSMRPISFSDFIFYKQLLKKYKPFASISNFGATNVMAIIGFLYGVKNRLNYVHTTSEQIKLDNKGHLKNTLLRFRKFFIYRLHTHLLTNSEGTLLNLRKVFRVNREKISVLNILIAPSKNYFIRGKRKSNKIILVGRLHKSKGHIELIRQFSRVKAKWPDLKLHIIGSGPEIDSIKNEINHLNISENVLLTGNVPYKDIFKEFESALISISSSLSEAFGLVNIEALKCGTPIISTKTAGGIEILTENCNGRFIDLNDESSLVESITSIMIKWEYYSRNALKTFNKRFHQKYIPRHVDKIEQIFNDTNN